MQRYLTVVRHAKSSWKESGSSDFDRGLNARGERDLLRIEELFAELPGAPDVLLASPAVRARQTVAGILAGCPGWAARVRYEARLYNASVHEVLEVVGDVSAAALHVMVVGHNPSLADVVSTLLPDGVGKLPTLGVVCLESDAVTWDTLSLAAARLHAFTYPKVLA
jgi:phosphohistidine phosphatase